MPRVVRKCENAGCERRPDRRVIATVPAGVPEEVWDLVLCLECAVSFELFLMSAYKDVKVGVVFWRWDVREHLA